jgi:Initiator Replication protein
MSELVKKNARLLIKHSAAVHINNPLTLAERKLANALLQAAYRNLLQENVHQISLKDLLPVIGWDNSENVSKQLIESIESLVTISIEWNILGRDRKRKWGVSTFLASAEVKDGTLYYEYSTPLREWLAKPNVYTTLNLEYQKKLSSKYTISLWELCSEILDTQRETEPIISEIEINKLKKVIGASEKTYEEFKYFYSKLIKPSIKEINEITDLQVEIQKKRTGRKITDITFIIKRKLGIKQLQLFNQDMETLITESIVSEDIRGRGAALALSDSYMQSIISIHGVKVVSDVLQMIIEKIKKGDHIESVGGYIHHLLTHERMAIVSSEELRPKLVEQQDIKTQNDKKQLADWIAEYIEQEKNLHRKALLIGCQYIIPASLIKKGIDDKEFIIDAVEEKGDGAIMVMLRHTARYNGFESKIYAALQSSFKNIGYKAVDIYINYPAGKGGPKKL